ncbi:YAF9 [Symbiodinium sp. KB8]|nr:YAF9 [Symbiodinium sp. KB8]
MDARWTCPCGLLPLKEVALERQATGLAANEMKALRVDLWVPGALVGERYLNIPTFAAVLSVVAPLVEEGSRAPLHLVAVLDRSGSMGGEKIRLVKQTMKFMLRYLSARDSLGIVEYGSDVKVAAPLTKCDQDGRARLAHALEKIQISGQTNLSGGLLKGLELHRNKTRAALSEGQVVQVGNTYHRLTPAEAEARLQQGHYGVSDTPAGAERVHEWTMMLRFPEDTLGLVNKVVFHLHETFSEPVVEVAAPPFQITRFGWGTFDILAVIHLQDGRELKLTHTLSFDRPETFRTALLPLKLPASSSSGFWGLGLCGAAPEETEEETIAEAVVRSTFLFTDGMANEGIRDTAGICAAATSMLTELRNCKSTISTFGFGVGHNAEMLRRLADTADGTYSHVETEDQIAEAFGEALGGLLSTTHQNVSLSLELAPGVGFLRAFTCFPVEPQDGRITVELGDLFAEERRDILVALSLPTVDEGAAQLQGIGRLEARGFSVVAKRSESDIKAMAVERRADARADLPRAEQVERHWNRHVANEALDEAQRTADGGNLQQARRILEDASATLGASPLVQSGDPVCLGLLSDLRECMADLNHREDYRQTGSKKMAMIGQKHSKQRSSNGVDTGVSYSNFTQKATRAAFKMGIA